MGMGYGANFAVTLSVEQIAERSPVMQEIIQEAKILNMDLSEFFRSIVDEDESVVEDCTTEVEYASLKEKLEQVVVDFEEENGIAIMPGHHNKEDEGSRYDQVNGAYFEVVFNQFYKKSEAAIKLEEKFDVKEALYVSFG